MSIGTILDIVLVVFLVLGTYMGARKGLIKSLVGFIGTVAIIIISYALRTPIATFMINNLPFFNFGGSIEGLTSLNILIYNLIAFAVIFIVMYCLLNIILGLTKFIDTILKFTVIWVIPSKIGGAIVGFLESWLFLFLILFVLNQCSFVNFGVFDGKIADVVLDYTPVIGNYLSGATNAARDIYATIEEEYNTSSTEELNLTILQIQIKYGIISKDLANDLVQTGKLEVGDVMFGYNI